MRPQIISKNNFKIKHATWKGNQTNEGARHRKWAWVERKDSGFRPTGSPGSWWRSGKNTFKVLVICCWPEWWFHLCSICTNPSVSLYVMYFSTCVLYLTVSKGLQNWKYSIIPILRTDQWILVCSYNKISLSYLVKRMRIMCINRD